MYRIRGKIVIYVRQMLDVKKLCATKGEKSQEKMLFKTKKQRKLAQALKFEHVPDLTIIGHPFIKMLDDFLKTFTAFQLIDR